MSQHVLAPVSPGACVQCLNLSQRLTHPAQVTCLSMSRYVSAADSPGACVMHQRASVCLSGRLTRCLCHVSLCLGGRLTRCLCHVSACLSLSRHLSHSVSVFCLVMSQRLTHPVPASCLSVSRYVSAPVSLGVSVLSRYVSAADSPGACVVAEAVAVRSLLTVNLELEPLLLLLLWNLQRVAVLARGRSLGTRTLGYETTTHNISHGL